jgi:hypothetical protein
LRQDFESLFTQRSVRIFGHSTQGVQIFWQFRVEGGRAKAALLQDSERGLAHLRGLGAVSEQADRHINKILTFADLDTDGAQRRRPERGFFLFIEDNLDRFGNLVLIPQCGDSPKGCPSLFSGPGPVRKVAVTLALFFRGVFDPLLITPTRFRCVHRFSPPIFYSMGEKSS